MAQPLETQEGCGLTDAQKRELERRLAAYEASGYKGDSWENVVERIRAKRVGEPSQSPEIKHESPKRHSSENREARK